MQTGYESTLPAASRSNYQQPTKAHPPPEQLDDLEKRFELLHALGRGSYGSVYKAREIETGEFVAIKIIPLTEQDEMESIQKEIAMLRDCSHPNVVKYFGSWRAPDSLWIAMEYCAGGSVSDIMAACDAALEEAVISYVTGETLAGLAYLHSQGRVHRDIKCGNILLTDGGEVKLADFGVAAQLTSTLSKRNTFIGTPHWMAPEVITASHYDGKVDIWALGITVVEMAERYPPRWRVNPNRVIFMVVRDPPPRLADKERWSLAFQDFVAQCLTKDARSRPMARYLQQHRFIARDRNAGLRALLPAIQRARAQYAVQQLHAPPAMPTVSDDGVFSWRPQAAGTVLGPDRQPATAALGTLLQHGPGGVAGAPAWDDSLESWQQRQQGPGAEQSGTVLVRGPEAALPEAAAVGTVLLQEASMLSAQAEASMDYLAAVSAAAAGPADLDFQLQAPLAAAPSPQPQRPAPVSETQRLVERLHVLHSSGAVVPLPFLKTTDVAPLTLVGLEGGVLPNRGPDWQGALRDVIAEAASGAEEGGAKAGRPLHLGQDALPPALVQRVLASPMLLNLAAALARHKAAQEEQRLDGVPPRAQEQLRHKAEALSDTLRTILCL